LIPDPLKVQEPWISK